MPTRSTPLFTDPFTDTASTALSTHNVGYVNLFPINGNFTIDSGGTKLTSGYANAVGLNPVYRYTGSETSTLAANHWVSALVSGFSGLNDSYHMGVCVRCTGDLDAVRDYYLGVVASYVGSGGSQGVHFGKVINGTYTQWGTSTGVVWSNGDEISIEDNGDVITLLKNGTSITATTGSFTKDVSGDVDKLATSGKPGLIAGNLLLLDDFKFGNFSSSSIKLHQLQYSRRRQ